MAGLGPLVLRHSKYERGVGKVRRSGQACAPPLDPSILLRRTCSKLRVSGVGGDHMWEGKERG